jgi:serine/threonine protein kinase
MAEVWLATAHGDAGFTRRVAIKQLFPAENDGGAFERMFLDEARITSRLHHAAIVSILDFGVEAGRPFQVLELVDGFDVWRLSKWGREAGKPMPPGLALHVCAVVGHALHFAHVAVDDAGQPLRIVHRDVSPQNVLVSRGGDVKLSDFGIAFAEGRAEKTVGGIARGKPAYMAPEQAVRGAMDGRTDVFGLGCVLHALIAGESALRDENALVDLLAGVELKLDASLPEPVREIVAKATRRNKAERYDTAEEMALACAKLVPELLSGEPRTALSAWVEQVASNASTASTSSLSPRGRGLETATIDPPPPRPRRWPWIAALGVVGLGLGYVFAPVEELAAPETDVVVAAPVQTRRVVPPLESPLSDPSPLPTPSPPGALARGEREAVVKVQPALPPPPTPSGTGVLTIGGELFLRGEIFVDGTSRGFAPSRLELPVGPHRVEIVGRDGVKHGPRELVVTRQHTQSAPLTWEE